MRATALEAAASGFSSCHALLAAPKRASLSGVNSRQRKSGGFGKVDELVSACSAMSRELVVLCCTFAQVEEV